MEGIASYYAEEFQGRKTANGETYDMNGLSAAHRTLPYGTVVRVTNKENGKSVTVRINDRGPFKGDRVIDLSLGAAKELGMIGTGTAAVVLEVVKVGEIVN
jgi:rare lipoprotein A